MYGFLLVAVPRIKIEPNDLCYKQVFQFTQSRLIYIILRLFYTTDTRLHDQDSFT